MPHITVEYSANVAQRTDVQQLVQRIHGDLVSLDLLPLAGLRTKAFAAEHYAVADEHPDNGYLAVFARLAEGRSAEQRELVMSTISASIESHLGEAVAGLALSVEYIEIAADMRVNINHIRDRLGE